MASSRGFARLKSWLRSQQARRVAAVVGKGAASLAAAGGGLALGLREVKRGLKAEEPVDIWREACVDVRQGSVGSVDGKALVKRVVEASGIHAADFQAAAASLRPVELELEELSASSPAFSQEAAMALVERWRANGYFEKLGLTGSFGRRLTSDAQGVDIGVLVPPYLCSDEDGSRAAAVRPADWGCSEREAAVASLQRWGCTLLRGAITAEDIAKLRAALGLHKTGADTRRATEIGKWMLQHDPNVAMGRYTFGRLHCLLRGSPAFESDAVAAHAAFAPLVHSFFREACAEGDRVFLSEAQLVIADPCAEMQRWHMDSGHQSLTFLVPLTNVDDSKGPQVVLPGTHHLHDQRMGFRERLSRCFSTLCRTHGAASAAGCPVQSADAPEQQSRRHWLSGDALVLDGRLLHRGLGNESLGAPVPILILRYDLAATPPPGCGRARLLFMARVGAAFDAVFRLYSVV